MLYILNSPILTSFGVFIYKPLSLAEAISILKQGFTSAVGHEATASFLSQLTGLTIPVNRIQIQMKPGDKAIVFQVLQRLPEGKVLSEEELKAVPYRLGLLEMETQEVE
jgi:hypothetical protein